MIFCKWWQRWKDREKKRIKQDRQWVHRLNSGLEAELHAGAMTREDVERLKS